MAPRGRRRRVVAPPTRLGPSEEGDLTASAPAAARRPRPRPEPAPPPPAQDQGSAPTLPTHAGEDTEEAWGDLPENADDDRYLREKPPHWQ